MSTEKSDRRKKSPAGVKKPQRVMVYVDGMNLYYGTITTGVPRYLWLDVWALAVSLLRPGQTLVGVKYYTSRFVSDCGDTGMARCQAVHLDALSKFDDLEIVEGRFQAKRKRCMNCGHEWQSYEEKMTDVNIAIGLMTDAEDNNYDVAIVISGDGDLIGPVETVLSRHPSKVVVVASPPNRRSAALSSAASAFVHVVKSRLRNCQLPDRLHAADGYPLSRPAEWQ